MLVKSFLEEFFGRFASFMSKKSSFIIDIQNNALSDASVRIPSVAQLNHWSRAVFEHEYLQAAEITLRLVDQAEMQALNLQFRGKNKPTNVLSFPAHVPNEVTLEIPFLGDIILCVPVIQQEAKEQNKYEEAHWAHMVAHGILHLLGYDHVNENDAQRMEEKEILILKHLHFDNPYQGDEE